MKTNFKFVLFIVFLFFLGCKNKSTNPALASLNLVRGELQLCGNGQFGDVNFSESCSYETRATFNLAIALLHSFEYIEAEKAFVQVIDQDPECAMAYWGVAMSIYHGLWAPPANEVLEKGSKLLKVAEKLPKSKKAEQYLAAIGAFYQDWDTVDNQTRKERYAQKMKEMYQNNTDDTEVGVFYALAIRAAADPSDKTYARQKKSGKILEDLFVEKPNHPGIAHYVIHNYDYPELASKALNIARRYAEIAPASAHAQHMPSHIFTRLGLWEESINTNINSASSAICYGESVNPDANWAQEIHAVDYLVYAYLQEGDNKSAIELVDEMSAVNDVFPKNDFAATYALTAMPVRMVLETKQWHLASKLEFPSIDFPWNELPWESAMLHFGKALGFSHTGKITSAEGELKSLESLHQKLLDEKETYKAAQVNVQVHAAKGWVHLAKGENEEALDFMRKAANLESKTSKHPVTPGEVLPADELLGDMLLKLNKPTEALEAYELNLKGHPNRFNGLYGAAIAAKKSGNDEKAMQYFNQLIELTKNSKSDRPEVEEALKFIQQS
jgi:tetratricopeptide (TPR) repeat protein